LNTVITHLPISASQVKLPGAVTGKDLRHGFFVDVGDLAVVEDVVIVLVFLLALARPLCPLVLVGGVVDHHVEHQQHVAPFQRGGQRFDIIVVAETRVDLEEIAHRVAAVAVFRRTVQHRHDMQQVDAEFLQIGQVFAQAFQVVGETVAVQRHADPFLAEEPVVVAFPRQVGFAQRWRAFHVAKGQRFDQADHLRLEVVAFAIEQLEQGMDGIEIRPQPGIEMAQALLADLGLQLDQDFVQQGMRGLFVHEWVSVALQNSVCTVAGASQVRVSGMKCTRPSRMPAL
jgi:hypothetical protein